MIDCRHKTVEKDKIGLKVKAYDEDGGHETGDENTSMYQTGTCLLLVTPCCLEFQPFPGADFAEFERKCLEEGEFRLEEDIEETELRIAGIKSLTGEERKSSSLCPVRDCDHVNEALFDVSERKRVCRYLLYHVIYMIMCPLTT